MCTNVELCVSDYSAEHPESVLLRSTDVRKMLKMTRDAYPVQEICQFDNPLVFGFLHILQLFFGLEEFSEQSGKLWAIWIQRHHVVQDRVVQNYLVRRTGRS